MSTVLRHSGPPTSKAAREHARSTVWLIVAALLVGLGSGVLLGRVTKADPAPPADLAPSATVTMINRHTAAVNSGDATRIAAFYAENATMTDIGNKFAKPVHGAAEIARALAGNIKLFGPGVVKEPGTAVQRGTFVTFVGSWGDVEAGVIVLELDSDGKILNQWAIHPAQ